MRSSSWNRAPSDGTSSGGASLPFTSLPPLEPRVALGEEPPHPLALVVGPEQPDEHVVLDPQAARTIELGRGVHCRLRGAECERGPRRPSPGPLARRRAAP